VDGREKKRQRVREAKEGGTRFRREEWYSRCSTYFLPCAPKATHEFNMKAKRWRKMMKKSGLNGFLVIAKISRAQMSHSAKLT
jgi:hypothetical protein